MGASGEDINRQPTPGAFEEAAQSGLFDDLLMTDAYGKALKALTPCAPGG